MQAGRSDVPLQRNITDETFCSSMRMKWGRSPIDWRLFGLRPHFFLTPSLSEVAPLVVLEAFSAGVVVMGTCATPFYDELSSLGIPNTAYTFLPFPATEDLCAERQSLRVADLTALSLSLSLSADKLVQLAEMLPMSTYNERCSISQAAYNAGFTQEQMLGSFQAIYDEALFTTGT